MPANNTATAQHPAGCTFAAYAVAKSSPSNFSAHSVSLKSRCSAPPSSAFPIPMISGAQSVARFRHAVDGKDKFRWRKGSKLRLYGLNRVAAARDLGEMVIVEGESDCHTLWHAGLPAIGLPGAGNWNEQRDAAFSTSSTPSTSSLSPTRAARQFANGSGNRRYAIASSSCG